MLLQKVVLGILLLAAAFSDLKREKIPNVLILSGWFFGLIVHFLQEGVEGVFKNAITAFAILAAGFLLFLIRAIGAGDVKLCSVIGGIQGMSSCIEILAVSFLLAGIWSLVRLVKKQIFAERVLYAWSYFMTGGAAREPYYNKNRDGTDCTILLAPFLATGYFLVLLRGIWK